VAVVTVAILLLLLPQPGLSDNELFVCVTCLMANTKRLRSLYTTSQPDGTRRSGEKLNTPAR